MGNRRRRIWSSVRVALALAALALAAAPEIWMPGTRGSHVALRGAFAEEVVRADAPAGSASSVPLSLELRMDAGVCRVGLERDGVVRSLFSARTIEYRDTIPAGSRLVLDPLGNPGSYRVTIGGERARLGPRLRRLVFLPAVVAMLVTALVLRGRRSILRRLDRRRVLFVAVVLALSGSVLYPAAHEAGHLLAGVILGGQPDLDGFVWTAFASEPPHAPFSHLPESARPWMSAGGTILPLLLAAVLLALCRLIGTRAPWLASAALLTVGTLFLLSALGCPFELYRGTHVDALSVHLGLSGLPRLLLSLGPLLLAAAVLVAMVPELRRLARSLHAARSERVGAE